MTGCGGVTPKPADPPAAAPTTPTPAAAEYSCGDGYIFDGDQLPGPEGAVVNNVFYWGSSTSGAARCYSDTRNNNMVGRVESNAGDATGAVVMSVTLPDEIRWYFIRQFPDGTYCSAATEGGGRATCFATVERDATGFRLDDLPPVTLPVPAGAPEPPLVEDPSEPHPGGGDGGGGQTGAPEPEDPQPVGDRFRWGGIEEITTDQRRWYLVLGTGPGEIIDGRDDPGPHDPGCTAATKGDGIVTCTATVLHSGYPLWEYNPDDFPTSTSPQSSEGNDAITARAVLRPERLAHGRQLWYLILVFADDTACAAATAGDGIVTCTATVERRPNGHWGWPDGPGPGGGDGGGGQTGAPEPEAPQPVGNKFRWGGIMEIITDQRRWYLVLGTGPGEIIDGRDDPGPHDPGCTAATKGDGIVTCTATVLHSGYPLWEYNLDDFPTSTSPQSSEGNDAIDAAAILHYPDAPDWDPQHWYLVLEFADGTACAVATAGDGIVTCTATVERLPNGHWGPP